MIEVLAVGILSTVQDLGRPGHAHLGVPPSGALDGPALRLANRVLGNPEEAAGIEMTLAGAKLRFHGRATIAFAGAAPRSLALGSPITVAAGDVVDVGPLSGGARTYLAVRGGIDVPAVLGSRSTDILTGLGTPPLAKGDLLPVGTAYGAWPGVDVAPVPAHRPTPTLEVVPGPRDDWFEPDVLERLTSETYVVTPDGNRVGLKLSGPALARRTDRELPSGAS